MAGAIVLTGGGTGGHIFPMLAVSDALQTGGILPASLELVGSRRGQERRLWAGRPEVRRFLLGRGIVRSLHPRNILSAVQLKLSTLYCVGRCLFRRPAVVVSFGGYAAFPMAMAAGITRTPLVLVELDAVASATNRVAARWATRRCLAVGEGTERDAVTGAPVRADIETLDRSDEARERARRALNIDTSTVVVVMTGSLGARSVNMAVAKWVAAGLPEDVTVLHVTGRRDAADVAQATMAAGDNYRRIDFADNMPALWQAADVAICRSGATTVAELVAIALPSVLVPLPGAPGDHQTHNASALAAVGGAVVIADRDVSASSLSTALSPWLAESRSRLLAEVGLRQLRHPGAATAIARVIREVAHV